MIKKDTSGERSLEIILILITVVLGCVLYRMSGQRAIVLNLFYLPVVLAGFFLGRYRAGVLSLLCVVLASMVIVSDLTSFSMATSPIVVGLSVTIWGAILGLTALMVGTLCDERVAKAIEAREAHVGVVEVLARYLQSANPRMQHRAQRVSELSDQVARRMRLSEKEIDDIRVAALMMDMENLEITARVIKKAVGELEDSGNSECTFHGTDLVQSLGGVLTGAFPLLLTQDRLGEPHGEKIPFGAHIIRTVRHYDDLAHSQYGGVADDPMNLIVELECDTDAEHHPAVLHALQEVLGVKSSPCTANKACEQPAAV